MHGTLPPCSRARSGPVPGPHRDGQQDDEQPDTGIVAPLPRPGGAGGAAPETHCLTAAVGCGIREVTVTSRLSHSARGISRALRMAQQEHGLPPAPRATATDTTSLNRR